MLWSHGHIVQKAIEWSALVMHSIECSPLVKQSNFQHNQNCLVYKYLQISIDGYKRKAASASTTKFETVYFGVCDGGVLRSRLPMLINFASVAA